MLKAGIVIDNWKLPIFDRHLRQAGYVYEAAPGVTDDTMALIVFAESKDALEIVARAANTEAAKKGAPR